VYKPPVRPRVLLTYAAVCVLWGSTWLVAKWGLADLPPLRMVGVRMLVAAALLLPFALRAGLLKLAPELLRFVLVVGLLQVTIPYGLIFLGQARTPSGLAAVLFSTFPVWLVLFGRWLVPGERLTARKLGAAALGLAGVVVLQRGALSAEGGGPAVLAGGLFITAGSMVCALANALVKRRGAALHPGTTTFVQTLSAGATLLAASLLLEAGAPGAFTPRALTAIGYLALGGTVLTYVGFYWLLSRIPLVAVGTIPLVDTTVAVSLGVLVAGEPFGPRLAIGAAMVLGASALSISGGKAAEAGGDQRRA